MITYDYGDVKGTIYVWRGPNPVRGMDKSEPRFSNIPDYLQWEDSHFNFYWSALGNTGEEETKEKAIQAARNWVRNSITKNNKET